MRITNKGKTGRSGSRAGAGIALLLFFAALGWWISVGRFQSYDEGSVDSTSVQSAPEFELKDVKGLSHRLESWRGKIIVLHFWAGWCPPCLAELGEWITFSDRMKKRLGDSVVFVAISLDKNWEDATKVLSRSNATGSFISLLDPEMTVSEKYGSYQFPETYFISRDLKIREKWVGSQEWGKGRFAQELEHWVKQP